MGPQDLAVLVDLMVLRAVTVIWVLKDLRGPKEIKAIPVTLDRQDRKDWKVPLVLVATVARRVVKVPLVLSDRRVPMDRKDPSVLLALKAWSVLGVLKDRRVRMVLKV